MAREDGPSYPHPNGRCRFLDFQRFHSVSRPWDSVSSIFVVICGYSYDLINFKSPATAGFDGNSNPTTTGS